MVAWPDVEEMVVEGPVFEGKLAETLSNKKRY